MRKTRSQTQAENALLSGSATNSSRSGVVSSSTNATSHQQQQQNQQQQQHQMNSGNPQKRGNSQQQSSTNNINFTDPARLKVGFVYNILFFFYFEILKNNNKNRNTYINIFFISYLLQISFFSIFFFSIVPSI